MNRPSLQIAAAFAVFALVACRGSTKPAPVVRAENGFPHDRHGSLTCASCHPQGDSGKSTQFPDHTSCSQANCHAQLFVGKMTAETRFCASCHVAGKTSPGFASGAGQTMALQFSHQVHLDNARFDSLLGFHVSCGDCHDDPERKPSPGDGHVLCQRCHVSEAATGKLFAMQDCVSCHRTTVGTKVVAIPEIAVKFSHDNHKNDAQGRSISCIACHRAANNQVVRAPTAETCQKCHDDADKVASAKRMRVCETCHPALAEGLSTMAPENHLPKTALPPSHTLRFRTEHQREAAAPEGRCADCHKYMSGSSVDNCEECHRVMEPQDHRAAWVEIDHGVSAVRDAKRCATCHTGDTCTTCHAEPPRNHIPVAMFATARHAPFARRNPRSCLVCHDAATQCATAGCHE